MTKNSDNLVALAEKGSLQRFSACLFNQDHAKEELFDALRNALLWNQAEKARLLLEAGADALMRNKEEDQLLTHAAIGGNSEIVRLMINRGCDPTTEISTSAPPCTMPPARDDSRRFGY